MQLFKDITPRKISVFLRSVPDLSDFGSCLQGKVIQIRDITEPGRHVIVNLDVEGKLINIKLGNNSSTAEVKLLERSFDGKFYIYVRNCENLVPISVETYYYYDYYEQDVQENIDVAKVLVSSVFSMLAQMSRADYSTTDTIIFKVMKEIGTDIVQSIEVDRLPTDLTELLENARQWYDWDGLLENQKLFNNTYPTPVSVLPPEVRPDQNPLFAVIQITQGCWIRNLATGPCKFCNSYSSVLYREKRLDELQNHLAQVKDFTGRGWMYVRKLFLSDADPFHTETNSKYYLEFLASRLPDALWYEAFVSTATILSKSEIEWEYLLKLGLKKLYWGVESADESTLRLLGKPHTKDMLYRAARILTDVGIPYTVIIMSGIGGLNANRSEKDVINNPHISETANFISDVNPSVVYVSKFVPQFGTEIFNLINAGRLKPLSPDELDRQHRIIVKLCGHGAGDSLSALREVRGAYGTQFVFA